MHPPAQWEAPPEFYQEVGLRVGLEVHQQLHTKHKMFCRCPAGLYTQQHDGEVLRHMRPTLSELGEYDGTALMEFKTRKNIIYLLHQSNVCTYEMDDTPPFPMNPHALDVAVEQCLMLGCDIVDEVHVARKQYLDGSIPTGFQRTAIVGVNGKLPFLNRTLTITQVSVEEDSCREVQDDGHLIVWRTDRLGMPLIETVTGANLHTPEEVVKAILLIGRVCRSTGHVRVGLGASRQDINVSVRGGRRVEIKGVPQAWWARKLVHGEAQRQKNLLALRDWLAGRGFQRKEDLTIEDRDVTAFFEHSPMPFLLEQDHPDLPEERPSRLDLARGEGPFSVRAVILRGLGQSLSFPTQPGKSFADELAGRVRVIAGLNLPPILLSSEAWPEYRGSARELENLCVHLGCGPRDSFVIVRGARQDTLTAAQEIRLRYEDALDGVPLETRQPFPDGSTDFERILPGPNRMYPDTDSPPIRMTRERVERLQADLPPPPWIREERYLKEGIPLNTIHFLIRRNGASLVDHVVERCGADLRTACYFFGEKLKGLRRSGVAVDDISKASWCDFFSLTARQPALWGVWKLLVRRMAADPMRELGDILREAELLEHPVLWKRSLEQVIRHGLEQLNGSEDGKLLRYCMGKIMATLRGKVLAQDVASFLSDRLRKQRQEVTST